MDEKPFFELDLLDLDENLVPELLKLTKSAFDVESIVNAAGELKYVSQMKKIFLTQFTNPEEDFVKFFASRVYDGILTQKVREQFNTLTRKAASQLLNDQVNERLKSALSGSAPNTPAKDIQEEPEAQQVNVITAEPDQIVTSEEELEGFHIVKSIIRTVVDVKRITPRDTKSYFGILIDDNNRKPICRLHFNRTQFYIGLFDAEKNETRHPIESLDDIYQFTEHLNSTAQSYT